MLTSPRCTVPLIGLVKLNQAMLMVPAPPLVSLDDTAPSAGSGVNDNVPVKAGAKPFGTACRVNASLSSDTPGPATSVTGMRVVPPTVVATGVLETTPCTVPACERITDCPAMISVAVRALDGFAVIE